MSEEEKKAAKIAAMELLLQQGYISLAKFIELIRNLKK
jgi:hypothetical protein